MSSASSSASLVPGRRLAIPALPLRSVGLALLLALAFVGIPLVATDYWYNAILIPFLIMALAGLGLNLTMGYAGQASLGTGAFMAVGAYATYNLLLRLPSLPLPASLALGGLIAGLAGLVVGLPSLRIKGFYLIAPTLAGQFLIEWTFNQVGWFSNYASSSSISAPRLAILGRDLSSPAGRYALTLSSVAVVTAIAWRLVRSQTGRNWRAVRDGETAAAVIGVPVARAKLSAFFAGAAVCGVAGALWAFAYLGTVDARSFDLDRSFQAMFIIIIGGLGSLAGSFIGSAFIVLTPILLTHLSEAVLGAGLDGGQVSNIQRVIFGALIIGFLIKEPNGLVALIGRLWRHLVR
ncbi:branched-chain amino acid ABC transporter permease [Methylobacterium pseudosasicola]|uniref:Amino acid/amide ABC transporter membrane protein 2, HAAT family n=1 Tax=Methylobacterium pseudosasicola TaxID=582667 RepID=A0A1I4HAR5_9HYPH|nr:branched-chain amino acid ABC transporter permease [Methylobacterium pseudosasicola]SFL39369.1 amino acid/amide ABC transporter membrane protein 2, HAAT family [Methylobacterium pseudosasicola]